MTSFQWQRQPKAEALIEDVLQECARQNSFIEKLQTDLLHLTSSRLFDWLDHVLVGHAAHLEKELEEAGFEQDEAHPEYRVFYHPGAQLPRVVILDKGKEFAGIAVKVERASDFLMAHCMTGWIEGSVLSEYRRCLISTENNVSLWMVERRGTRTLEPVYMEDKGYAQRYLESLEKWQTRPRDLENEEEAMDRAISLTEEIVETMGRDLAAWIVLEAERMYWESRNFAGQLQKNRQDKLGMGWANHDHHTFRSSRKHFPQLVRLFEILGFHTRERFYAGEEAGWGAQVMENSIAGLVLFLDLDLEPHELEIDFAHQSLAESKHMGTVGLWCALHGDSILKSGMHHLEAQFMHDQLTEDLANLGIRMMDPFSDFSYLKQAFTAGEIWQVDHKRIQKLANDGMITNEEADKFRAYGAVGSHMENLQRREGYKGFNQKNVSFIIKKTDPRTIGLS